MEHDPYRVSGGAGKYGPQAEIPEDVLKKIKGAWVAALISAAITFVIALMAMSGTEIAGINAWSMIDVAFILGLAYGIYRKSRTCAVLMFVYFVVSKALLGMEEGKFNGMLLAIVFLYYYANGIAGTFQYHKLMREAKA